jgi:predicted TIM-barrel fold metal-dependent hydrolase
LLPNYHGFRLYDAGAAELMALARERRMIVQVFQRIADERWHWMLKVPAVDQADLDYLTASFDQPILLSGVSGHRALASRLAKCPGLYADISRVRGPQFAIEKLVKAVPSEKLVFGSLWPIQIIEATLWQVTTAKIGDETKRNLLAENARRMLADSPSS